MVGVGRSPEIRQVATHTIRTGQVVIVIHMALGALHTYMRTGQREGREVVIEGNGSPVCRVVASRAILREPRLHVVGILRARKIFQMATDTVGGSDLEIAIHVAGLAVQRGVHAGERIARVFCVVKPCAHPSVHVVAALASRRKLERPMVGLGGGKILHMTRHALRGKPLELAHCRSLVTLVAHEHRVGAHQRKSVLMVVDGLH